MAAMLAGQLPAGVQLQPNPTMLAMTGHGELWVDSDGLPRREILTLAVPAVTEQLRRTDRHRRRLLALRRRSSNPDASADRRGRCAGAPRRKQSGCYRPDCPAEPTSGAAPSGRGRDGARRCSATCWQQIVQPLRRGATTAVVILPMLALVALLVSRQRRSLYVAVVSALIVIMVAQPLLDVGRTLRFASRIGRGRAADGGAASHGRATEDQRQRAGPIWPRLASAHRNR